MGTVAVEEVTVDPQRTRQAGHPEENEMIQALFGHAPHPAFRMGVGIGSAEGRLHHPRMSPGEHPVEIPAQQLVPVMEYEARGDLQILAVHEQIARHLAHPLPVRGEGRLRQHDAPRAQVQHEQHIGRPQPREGPHLLGEEIGAEHHLRVAREKLLPGQPRALRGG